MHGVLSCPSRVILLLEKASISVKPVLPMFQGCDTDLQGGLMGKAKPAKHTAAEIKAKVAAATTNKGGGNAGKEDRLGGKAGHAKYKCPVCAQQAPDMKTMQVRSSRLTISVSYCKKTFFYCSVLLRTCNMHDLTCW